MAQQVTTQDQLAEAAEVDTATVGKIARELQQLVPHTSRLVGLRVPTGYRKPHWKTARFELERIEMRKMATDLIDLGLRSHTIRLVLRDLNPARSKSFINSQVKRAFVEYVSKDARNTGASSWT